MIIQTSEQGKPNFAIEQKDHARTAGQLAKHFGNANFNAPTPKELVIYIVEHHDEGWEAIDALVEQSPTTGLPHHLTQTPLPYLIQTSKASPNFNEKHHAYCGLLSSMHTYGLFNGRYGLSDFIFIDKVSHEYKANADAMLAYELARQARLKAELGTDSVSSAWIQEEALFNNYKLLQFFDTLSLYFHTTHKEARKEATFLNVPDGKGSNQTLTISPRSDEAYVLSPWCFDSDFIEVFAEGRYINPQPQGTDFKSIFASTPKEKQIYKLVSK
jgi:hypothetical protein